MYSDQLDLQLPTVRLLLMSKSHLIKFTEKHQKLLLFSNEEVTWVRGSVVSVLKQQVDFTGRTSHYSYRGAISSATIAEKPAQTGTTIDEEASPNTLPVVRDAVPGAGRWRRKKGVDLPTRANLFLKLLQTQSSVQVCSTNRSHDTSPHGQVAFCKYSSMQRCRSAGRTLREELEAGTLSSW